MKASDAEFDIEEILRNSLEKRSSSFYWLSMEKS